MRTIKKMWTKDEMRKVLSLWEIKNTAQICEELNITKIQLNYIRTVMRRAGIVLPKKHKISCVLNLAKELALELNK